MVIVQSLRVWIIAKLTLFVLVIFGWMSFLLYGNRVYAACPDGYDYQWPSVDWDSDICTPSCDAQCQYEKKLGVRNLQWWLTDFVKCK